MPKLYGDRIVLREYRLEDIIPMRGWVNDPEIVDLLSDIFLYPQTMNETESYLNSVLEKEGDHRGFVIAHKDTDVYIGQIDLFRFDWKNRTAEMGIVIGDKELQGQGYGTEAIGIMLQFVFERLGLNRLQLEVYEYNEAAIRCYLKCGFQEEGRLRERHFIQGKYWDVVCMAVLRSDYNLIKAKKEN